MERLTTDKAVENMDMVELAHNSCYAEGGKARYRDYDCSYDAMELTKHLLKVHAKRDDTFACDEEFEEAMIDNLFEGMNDIEGFIALFYRNLWAMADLRETLKVYEDAEEQGLLLRLPCGVGDTVYYINFYQRKIEEDTVMEFSLETYDWYVRLRQNKWVILDMFKREFFLTREEAESALAEKGGAE